MTQASVTCFGHPDVTATHHKTLEISTADAITRRASCVVGVGAVYDPPALLALRGRIDVTIRCEGDSDSFRATVSPFFDGRGSLVFRRGPTLRGATFAASAEKTAATLDRRLVARLKTAGVPVTISMTEVPDVHAGSGVLYVACVPGDGALPARVRALAEVVDLVVEEPAEARRLHAGVPLHRVTDEVLDRLRAGDLVRAEGLLAAMDDVYAALVTVDFPDAITGGLRRTTDALRAVLERTRGDVTLASVQGRVERALSQVLGADAHPLVPPAGRDEA